MCKQSPSGVEFLAIVPASALLDIDDDQTTAAALLL
jgi:hypothetical protein